MAYVHGFTTADNILKDLATVFTTGDALVEENNWKLVYPEDIDSITDKCCFELKPVTTRQWVKREPQVVTNGVITVKHNFAEKPGTRVFVRDKKYYLYLKKDDSPLDIMEYRISGPNTIEVNPVLNNKQVLVDYEKAVYIESTYYVELSKPAKTTAGKDNHYYINWKIGENYDSVTGTFPPDHSNALDGKISWFKETTAAEAIVRGWLPIEYWICFDRNAGTGVLMGDPGLSISEWLSSPFYFGALKQIEGALETDLKGNFGGFGGSFSEPVLSKKYGDYTGTGVTDVVMVSTKTGRPYQAHKVAVFGAYEFREKTFNGQSAHTGKHPVSDIVIGDVHENDRGILYHCLAVPRVAKEHGTELIYNRYVSGEEETYIFLNINSPYTPFNTSPDVLLGFAIRTDI